MTADTKTSHQEERSVRGDLRAFARLLEKPASILQGADGPAREHVLTTAAVRDVLTALERQAARPDLVQCWASFMRRGYIAGAHTGPIRPLQIHYDPGAESAIAEVLARLDEIGDAVDGEVSDNEITEMLATLPE